jgi:hypothetical protein
MVVFSIFADIVVFIHFLWIVFLILGAILGVRYPIVKIIHIIGLAFSVIIQIVGWYCPLTHLEVWLRMRHDTLLSYTGSFIIHYIEQIVYLEISRLTFFLITIILVIINMWIYRRRKKK